MGFDRPAIHAHGMGGVDALVDGLDAWIARRTDRAVGRETMSDSREIIEIKIELFNLGYRFHHGDALSVAQMDRAIADLQRLRERLDVELRKEQV